MGSPGGTYGEQHYICHRVFPPGTPSGLAAILALGAQPSAPSTNAGEKGGADGAEGEDACREGAGGQERAEGGQGGEYADVRLEQCDIYSCRVKVSNYP